MARGDDRFPVWIVEAAEVDARVWLPATLLSTLRVHEAERILVWIRILRVRFAPNLHQAVESCADDNGGILPLPDNHASDRLRVRDVTSVRLRVNHALALPICHVPHANRAVQSAGEDVASHRFEAYWVSRVPSQRSHGLELRRGRVELVHEQGLVHRHAGADEHVVDHNHRVDCSGVSLCQIVVWRRRIVAWGRRPREVQDAYDSCRATWRRVVCAHEEVSVDDEKCVHLRSRVDGDLVQRGARIAVPDANDRSCGDVQLCARLVRCDVVDFPRRSLRLQLRD